LWNCDSHPRTQKRRVHMWNNAHAYKYRVCKYGEGLRSMLHLHGLTSFPQMRAYWKNLNGTVNFIFDGCCCEGQEPYSSTVMFLWLHHAYVLSLARGELRLEKTYISTTSTTKKILFLIKTGKIRECSLNAWEELYLCLLVLTGAYCGSLRGQCHPRCTTVDLASSCKVQHFQNRWVLFVLSRLWRERWKRGS